MPYEFIYIPKEHNETATNFFRKLIQCYELRDKYQTEKIDIGAFMEEYRMIYCPKVSNSRRWNRR